MALVACSPPPPPVVQGQPPLPTAADAPGWLPPDWVIAPQPAALDSDRRHSTLYLPRGAAAPLLLLSRLSAQEAAGLRRQTAQAPFEWLWQQLRKSVDGPGSRAGTAQPWRRAGLRQGQQAAVTMTWPEGERGLLSGAMAVGETPDGALLAVLVLEPQPSELPADLLAAVPLRASPAP
ncbi:MAG: hypothetical protein IT204_14465 [Fimbriimonadaceae bacterium]|nr:hypothetical protein [Fimbriimonadaceae bacterium]